MSRYITIFFVLIFFYSCGSLKNYESSQKREFRGVWIATVANIDWPKLSTDLIDKKKQDYLEILEHYKQMNFNAVIVQIRTAGDAFYPTQKAPWSRFLTGTEGQAELEYNNFLKWMIDEAHIRGFEFHAWLNPYRATLDGNLDKLSKQHDLFLHPDWMVKYGNKHYYNPGIPEVKDHLASVIEEVVTNYDIDAIHFDDYFYPYKIEGETFDDSLTYQKYKLPKQSIDDWRRSNVDSLVSNTYKRIKKIKPWVHFGISPFGVWKNKENDSRGSDTMAGQTTYEDLYADPLSWIENGWIDYIVPQLYWSLDFEKASHKTLLKWWSLNSTNTNLYIGNGSYKIRNNSDIAWSDEEEMPNQVKLAREVPEVMGNVFFSAKSMMGENNDIAEILTKSLYNQQALPPVSSLHPAPRRINKPKVENLTVSEDSIHIKLKDVNQSIQYLLIYQKENNKSLTLKKKIYLNSSTDNQLPRGIKPFGGANKITIPKINIENSNEIFLIYLDRYRNESEPVKLKVTS